MLVMSKDMKVIMRFNVGPIFCLKLRFYQFKSFFWTTCTKKKKKKKKGGGVNKIKVLNGIQSKFNYCLKIKYLSRIPNHNLSLHFHGLHEPKKSFKK